MLFLKWLQDSKCSYLNTKFRNRWTGGSLLKQKPAVILSLELFIENNAKVSS